MSHPVLWPKTYFYPVGNTSAVCLTQDLPPEVSANVLLLGCGDPRNILYTIHAGIYASEEPRQLDFTCCDYEPGVLARNVLLLTLVEDGSSYDSIWNIFFHFKLDADSLSLLVAQSKRLVEISKDIETWNSSSYSGFIRMCNKDTLARLHQYWSSYATFHNLPKSKIESIMRQFSSAQDTSVVALYLSAARSAGLFFTCVATTTSEHFSHYWKTGIVHRDQKKISAATKLNPTFVYSSMGEGCAVHYGTYPLQCFHLGEAFTSSQKWDKVQERDLINIAFSQFHRWCASLKSATSRGCVRIRLFAGDAVAFCHALRHIRITSSTESGLYTSAWSGSVLVLDSDDYSATSLAPTIFNVIETSNMIDHIGLLNVLIPVVPLLQPSPSTILYTEALLAHGEKAESGFLARFCSDVPVMALLLGVCPVGCVSNFCTQSNVHEILLHRFVKSKQYFERIAWKIPYFSNRESFTLLNNRSLHPSFESPTLAGLLSELYYNMFKDNEDLGQMDRMFTSMLRNSRRGCIVIDSAIHYGRPTFASFLGLVKSRVHVNWIETMEHMDYLLHSNPRLIVGSNYYQELCCQLHTRGIYTMDTLRTDCESQTTMIDRTGIFRDWDVVPPVVCVVLLVPRSRIKILEDKEPRKLGSPMLQCDIRYSFQYHKVFTAVQVTFGSIRTEGSGSDAKVIINEDFSGLSGQSPLILSFWVPAFNLVVSEPSLVRIGLGVYTTPTSTMALVEDIGFEMQVFSANLMDKDYVHVVSTRPHHSNELDVLRAVAPQPPPSDLWSVSIASYRNPESSLEMTARWSLAPGPGLEALSKATTGVSSKQIAPCTITVAVGNAAENTLVFPFPVVGEKIRLRIARKSGYIEAVGPVRWPLVGMGQNFAARASTMFLGEGNIPSLWSIHRLNLERLPVMQRFNNSDKLKTVNSHVSLAFSDYEEELRKKFSEADVLVNVKDTIHALFNRALEPNARQVFGLNDPNDGVYTIIFLNDIRLDLSSHTLVADGCVLPLTETFADRYLQRIGDLTARGQMVLIKTQRSEAAAWKHLLPAFTERCRTGWSHRETCEYTKSGVPLGTLCTDNPICSCGEGKNLGKLTERKEWKELSKFMTRIAISPLFANSYLTPVAGEDRLPADKISTLDEDTESKMCALTSCRKRGSMTCSRCKRAKYCSAECQRAHWKEHKKACKI